MLKNTPSRKVRIPKIAEIVAATIRRQIVTGELPPGHNLPTEAQLIENFEVSRPTIREALRILEFEELVSISRGSHGGARVNERSLSFATRAMGVSLQEYKVTLGDIYDARKMIEPMAASLAAQRRPVEASTVLYKHIEEGRLALQVADHIPDHNAQFHTLLVEHCGNQTLAIVAFTLADIVARHHRMAYGDRKSIAEAPSKRRLQKNLLSQEMLANLIENGDAKGAEEHWRTHMDKAGERFFNRFSSKLVVDTMEDQ